MAGITKAQVVALDPRHMQALQMEGGGAYSRADGSPLRADWRFQRPDRSQRFERDLGRALWFALALVVLWIGAS